MTNHEMEHEHSGGTGHDHQPSSLPTFGTHNQMMVGQQTVYLSHLPMFMFDPERHEHNFQVILEVALSWPGKARAAYVDDRRKHPNERMYTMSPHPFEMVELDPQHPRRTTLTGDIFRGHLERDGVVIIPCADALIVNTVYFHEFDPNAQPLDQLEYLLFGRAPDLFLAHVITRPPDFDQILGVKVSGAELTEAALRRGIRLKVPGRANTAPTRIKAGEKVTGQARLPDAQASQPLELQLETGTEFYFEEGELRLPMTMDQTSEEKKAGF